MNSRRRTQKKIFTPTSTPEPSSFLCKLIDTNEYLVVHRSSIKRLYDNTAEILVHGRRMEAIIEYQGTAGECHRAWKRLDQVHSTKDIDEGENEDDENLIHNDHGKNIHSQNVRLLSTASSLLNNEMRSTQPDRFVSNSIQIMRNPLSPRTPKRKRRNLVENTDLFDEESDDEQDIDNSLSPSRVVSKLMKHMDLQFNSIRKENDDKFSILSKKIERRWQPDVIDLTFYREGKITTTITDVQFNGENLLKLPTKSVGDYGRRLLRALYSSEELASSILPPGGSQYTRKPLDADRFEIFHKAMRGKYRISDDRYEEFYAKLVRPKLVDFLSDERKRWRKSNELLDRSKSNDQSNSTINNVSSTETPDAI